MRTREAASSTSALLAAHPRVVLSRVRPVCTRQSAEQEAPHLTLDSLSEREPQGPRSQRFRRSRMGSWFESL